jgi:N6-adenosine-specific RNA methylase IME4
MVAFEIIVADPPWRFASNSEAKPEALPDRIDEVWPDATKAELFARRVRPGWYCWGNELPAETS